MIRTMGLLHQFAAATANCGTGGLCNTGLPTVSASSGQLKITLQIIIGILAAVAVLMVTIGAFRYVISEGNPEDTKKARSTILYALVGLVITVSAEAIVSFALGRL